MPKKKVLVADDSKLIQRLVGDLLKSNNFEVITASNGIEAIEAAKSARPDVVILDVRMPVLDGLGALKEIAPLGIPVIMFSSITYEDSKTTIEALELGAFDFVPKPGGAVTLDISEVRTELLMKVRAAAMSNISPFIRYQKRRAPPCALSRSRSIATSAILVAASTGGPSFVKRLVQEIPADVGAAVMIVQHMPPVFTRVFAESMSSSSKIPVKEAEDGEPILENHAYVAPGDFHMEVSNTPIPKVSLNKAPRINYVRPAADPLFISAARRFGSRLLAVILTGMGSDGMIGARHVKEAGGVVIAQDAATSVVYGMPKAVADAGLADEILAFDLILKRVPEISKKLKSR